jgi:polysaccharide export outer membrane protein
MRLFIFVVFTLGLALNTACVSFKELQNYQEDQPDTTQFAIKSLPNIRIQANDVLSIRVFSGEESLAKPFNLTSTQQAEGYMNVESIQLSGYLVNQEGTIDFPVLGTLKLEGMSISEAKQFLLEQLKAHLKDAVVNMRLLNFRVTVSGEVRNPGAFNIYNERVSLLDALALAGDLTDYADRKNILLIREKDGVRSMHPINLKSASFFQSEFYYLKQNDLIYVRPLKQKAGAVEDQTSKAVPILSALGTLAAILIALFK